MHFKWAELTFSLIGKSPECKAEPSHTVEIHMLKYLLFFFFRILQHYSQELLEQGPCAVLF